FYLTCPIFVSVLPPRPLSTLFPYTTLFRSDRAAQFQVLTTATGAKIPWDGKSPLVASPNGAAVKQLSEGFAEFRRVFPPFISFSQVIPTDEVVCLKLFHREDEPLCRLFLNDDQKRRLD